MPNHRVEAIANEFIKRARYENKTLTNMQLQKLPYIAHGWGLVINGQELIDEGPEAWPYGPVYRCLYESLKRYGAGVVTDFIHDADGIFYFRKNTDRGEVVQASLSEDETKLLDAVWSAYKNLTAFDLSALTHQPESPWTITTSKAGPFHRITNDLIRDHYNVLAARRRAAA